METSVPKQLPLGSKISLLIWMVFVAPVQVIFNITRCVAIARSRHLPLRFYFTCGLLRVVLNKLTGRQLQFLLPGSTECYQKWIAESRTELGNGRNVAAVANLRERIEMLPVKSSSIMWLGDPSTADKAVLFFHGGGYKAPMSAGHMEWCLQAYVYANPTLKVAVALLRYALAPEAAYPVQLSQASSALAHVLRAGFRPSDIIIGGDSAGGNLTSQLLGHLLRCHPKVEAVQIDEPLLGVFLVSPFLSARTDTASFRENNYIDMLSAHSVSLAVADVFEGTDYETELLDGKGWALPTDIDGPWFDGVSRICRNLYVTVGQHEVLRDHGVEFAECIALRNPGLDVRLEIAEKEAHDFILLEGNSKIVGDATTRMRTWFNSIIS
ncbi:hypothetical protein FP744_10007099 [Trichoderma asperellum]